MRSGLVFTVLIFVCSLAGAQHEKWKNVEVEADTLMAHEDYPGALELYNQAIIASALKEPDTYSMLYKRAICLYSLNQFEDAMADIDDFIRLQPDLGQAKLLRAYIGRELGDTEIQISSLNDLLLIDPKNTELLKWRSSAFIDNGQYQEARNDIRVARKIQDDAELETYFGISYYYQDEADSAIVYFDKAIAIDTLYVTSYLYATSLSLDEEAYDLALHYVNKALQLDPSNPTLHFYKGMALVEKNNLTLGCRFLLKAFSNGVDDAGDYLKEYCYAPD
jgi:tetratricopeptide (TPR) repeat protein